MNAIPPSAHPCEPAASLEDGHGRAVRYIRLSVTDRCNLRCTYCRSGMETFIPHEPSCVMRRWSSLWTWRWAWAWKKSG